MRYVFKMCVSLLLSRKCSAVSFTQQLGNLNLGYDDDNVNKKKKYEKPEKMNK